MIFENPKKEQNFVFVFLFFLIFILTYFSLQSDGSYGGADSYVHYRIARYAPMYPRLYMDLWGKPLFTLCASSFAQFGFNGIKFFNIFVSAASCFVAYLLCGKLNLRSAFSVVVLLGFAPMFFMLALTGLTETFFSFVLLLSVYFFVTNRYFLSAFLISLAPFARQEGFLFLFFFAFAFVYRKKIKAIPILLSGSFIFSLICLFAYGDFFWIIKHMVYTQKAEFYGHGELLHFAKNSKEIFGYPLLGLTFAGILSIIIKNKSGEPLEKKFIPEKVLLIVIPSLCYFAIHSILWWKGLSGSFGLTRVMAAILPLTAVVGAEGFDFFASSFFTKKMQVIFSFLILGAACCAPFSVFHFPVHASKPELLMKSVSDWTKENKLDLRYFVYYDPYYIFQMGINPFNELLCKERIRNLHEPSGELMKGGLIIWDSHFGPNEGMMPKERLMQDSAFILIKTFKPEVAYKTIGGFDYEIDVFERR